MGGVIGMMDAKRARNIRRNLNVPGRLIIPQQPNGWKAILVCYGPSLLKTWMDIKPDGHIVSVSKSHDFLNDHGIVPDIHIEFDCRSHKAKHVNNPHATTQFWLASCVHPELVAKVAMPILWHAKQGPENNRAILDAEPDAVLVDGGSSVGLRAIELLYARGYRRFEIHGMDSSFDGDTQWAGPHSGTSRHRRDVMEAVIDGRTFLTSVAFATYATQFIHCRAKLSDATFDLRGDGLLQTFAKHKEKAA